MQRRSLLKLGVVTGTALALIGGSVSLLREPGWRDGRLTDSGRAILGAVARAVLDGSLPEAMGPQQAALASHLDRMDLTLRALPPMMQREIADMLALLAIPPGRLALAGLSVDWPRADVKDLQSALQGMRTSRINLRQQVYHALRDLTHGAYFADSATWSQLGYPGPAHVA